MFGIERISWEQFTGFILFVLVSWYIVVVSLAWYRKRNNNRKILFEEDYPVTRDMEGLKPVSVSSEDYPAQVIPYRLAEDIPLPVSFYEESGLDEGYAIESFSKPNSPELPRILEQIQFQQ